MTSIWQAALVLEYVPYIYYPFQFKKDIYGTWAQAMIDSGSEVNAIATAYTYIKVRF